MSDSFDAYVLPTGIRPANGGTKTIVSAVLVLRPVMVDDGKSDESLLESWPSHVAGLLTPHGGRPGLCVTMRTIDENGSLVDGPVGVIRSGLERAYLNIDPAGRRAVLPQLDGLWQRLLSPFPPLRKALAKPGSGQSSPLHEAILQIKPDEKPLDTPDIISPGRADLSHLLKFKRAGLIRDRVNAICGTTASAAVETLLQRRKPAPKASPWAAPVTMPKPPPPAVPQAIGVAPDGTPLGSALFVAASDTPAPPGMPNGRSRVNQTTALKAERVALLDALNSYLDGDSASAGENSKRPRPYAKAVASGVRTEALTAARKKQYGPPSDGGGEPPLPQGVRRAAATAARPDLLEAARVDRLHAHVHSALADATMFNHVNDPAVMQAGPSHDALIEAMVKTDGAVSARDEAAAKERWAAILGIPTLQRVLHLIVDVEVEFEGGDVPLPGPGEPRFVALGLAWGTRPAGLAAEAPHFFATLAKIAPDGRSIWPCAREELRASRAADETSRAAWLDAMDQQDGVMNLEAALSFGQDASHRFSVDSLDIHAASESEVQRDRSNAHTRDMIASLKLAPAEGQDQDAKQKEADARHLLGISDLIAVERKLRTIGCQVIDQWRDSIAIKQFVRTYDYLQGKTGGGLPGDLLDADDLMLGLRLDVAVDGAGAKRSWACLTNRFIEYTDVQGRPGPVEGLVKAFLSARIGAGERREALDGVVLGAPTRLLEDERKPGHVATMPPVPNTAFAEPIIATWDGDPLGMRSGRTTAEVHDGGLPLSLRFDLPTKAIGADEPLPPRLRLGAAYAFGLRTVLLGNVTLPLRAAAKLYDGGTAYPQQGELKRFLRHEWIDPVMVAMPLSSIVDEFKYRGGIDGEMLVVRSKPRDRTPDEPDDGRRFQPGVTERVVFASRVDLNFADLHGVFDGKDSEERLRGGMRNVDFDPVLGGFPAYAPELPAGSPLNRGTRAGAQACPGETPPDAFVPPSGLAVYRPRPQGGAPKDPALAKSTHRYFPDPAARYFVAALRAPWEDGPYLAGDPWVIPIFPHHRAPEGIETPGYPHAAPLVIRLEAAFVDGGEPSLTSYADLAARAGASSLRSIRIDPGRQLGPENVAQQLTICLAPGEDYTLEVWTIPELAHIAAWFDIPESMAFLSAAAGTVAAPDAASKPIIRREDMRVAYGAVADEAQALSRALRRRPVREFAPARQFRLVHAAERPGRRPLIVVGGAEPVAFRRVENGRRAKLFADPTTGLGARTANDDSAQEVLVEARVRIDPSTYDTIALRVRAAAPAASRLDDPQRGRSPEDRIRGDWPCGPTGTADPDRPSPSALLYGFEVASDGAATWIRNEAIFATWRIAPTDQPEVSLLSLTAKGGKGGRDSAGQQLFSDGGARRISACIFATARTARLIPERGVYPNGREMQADTARTLALSDWQDDIILRSIVRPAGLPIKTLLPAFFWSSGGGEPESVAAMTRTTRIRIPFSRPALTSGVEERVGIVLWPPNALRTGRGTWTVGDLARGAIDRPEPLSVADAKSLSRLDLLDLDHGGGGGPARFRDEDLGPGGSYVTRWGADPIHEAGELTWFIAPESFRDADWRADPIDSIEAEAGDTGRSWPEASRAPRLVENVLMPIPSGDEDDKASPSSTVAGQATQFMMVSLLTYVPRFDVDGETWYVDVELDPGVAPDPFLRLGLVRFQPHANRTLQVSMPTSEWVQVVGHSRVAELVVRARDGSRRPLCVEVRVLGAALAKSKATSPFVTFNATVILRHRNDLGHIVETEVPSAPRSDAEPISDRTLWRATLPPLTAWDEDGFEGYAVYVEERLRMRRADYAAEPGPDQSGGDDNRADDGAWRDSGPRFAARLEITRKM